MTIRKRSTSDLEVGNQAISDNIKFEDLIDSNGNLISSFTRVYEVSPDSRAEGFVFDTNVAFNVGTSCSLKVGTTSDNDFYVAATDVKIAAVNATIVAVNRYSAPDEDGLIIVTITSAGTVPTTGNLHVHLPISQPEEDPYVYKPSLP